MNRKGDKEPGIKAMCIGLQKLKDFTLAFKLMKLIQICGQGYDHRYDAHKLYLQYGFTLYSLHLSMRVE